MSKIEWTEETWNPVAGCSKVSAGCRNCYAERRAHRLAHIPATREKYAPTVKDGRWTGVITFDEIALLKPLRWRKPRRVFVNSMSDLFHPDVPFEWIDKVFGVMALTRQHSYQILTKHPKRMAEYVNTPDRYDQIIAALSTGLVWDCPDRTVSRLWNNTGHVDYWPLTNTWLGTSVEDQETADERIPHLLNCPAAVRFVSYEPALGPVDFTKVDIAHGTDVSPWRTTVLEGCGTETDHPWNIDWIICGGESGPNARPMHPDWARYVRDKCVAANVPFFFKQWGRFGGTATDIMTGYPTFRKFPNKQTWINKARTWMSRGDVCVDMTGNILRCGADFETAQYPVAIMRPFGKKAAGRLLDGREWNEFPEQQPKEARP